MYLIWRDIACPRSEISITRRAAIAADVTSSQYLKARVWRNLGSKLSSRGGSSRSELCAISVEASEPSSLATFSYIGSLVDGHIMVW